MTGLQLLLVLAIAQTSHAAALSTDSRNNTDVQVKENGVIFCSRSIYPTCRYYSSSFFLTRYKGLFSKESDSYPAPFTGDGNETDVENHTLVRRSKPGPGNRDSCCETNWLLQKIPLVTKNSKGQDVYVVAFGSYRQKAWHGRCSGEPGNCRKTCRQEYSYQQVLVAKWYRWYWWSYNYFIFDFIPVPISCLCIG